MSLRFVQLQRGAARRLALVEEPQLRLIDGFDSMYALAQAAIQGDGDLTKLISKSTSSESLDYEKIYSSQSDWHFLPPLDHPDDPGRTMVSGTGLTHLGSAQSRNAMHELPENQLTDSMRMFRLGLDGGRPAPGAIGAAPEWFYKGSGLVLRGHLDALDVPAFALDGGEEAEIAGAYLVDPEGNPRRIGMTIGNEFSDHAFEKINYLNLAGSKLRTCAIGPEMVVGPDFASVSGEARVERGGNAIWSKPLHSGDSEMCHSLQNIEHHHFKFPAHRRPGDVHIHFFGAFCLSFSDKIQLQDGDWMHIQFNGFGRPLRNLVRTAKSPAALISVKLI